MLEVADAIAFGDGELSKCMGRPGGRVQPATYCSGGRHPRSWPGRDARLAVWLSISRPRDR